MHKDSKADDLNFLNEKAENRISIEEDVEREDQSGM